MYNSNLWMREFRLREQRLMREAAGDRLADELRRESGASGLLSIVIWEALGVIRARIAPHTSADEQTSSTPYPVPSGEVSPILAEAEEIVKSYAGSSQCGGADTRSS